MIEPDIRFSEENGVVVAHLEGEIDLSNVAILERRLLGAVANDALGLVVDLSGTRYLDSDAIRCFFEVARRLTDRRQRLALSVPEESPLHSLLRVTRMVDAAIVCPSISSCIGQIAEPAVD